MCDSNPNWPTVWRMSRRPHRDRDASTWEGDGDALDASKWFQGVSGFGAEKFLEEIRSVTAD